MMESVETRTESPLPTEDSQTAVNEKPEEKYSVEDFFNAVRYGSRTHVAFILQHDSSLVHKVDAQGFSCMHWAAKRGEYDVLCQLQESGANLDMPASFDTQMRPIHWAASDGKIKSLKFLLDHRQDINAQDGNNCSPLIIAAQYGRVETVVYLAKNGADLNQRDVNGDTALHWGAYKGFEEVVGVLMHLTPQFKDLPDNFGQTPLHLAALRGNFDTVEFLVSEFDASTSIRDKNGCTPLMLTVKKEQLKTEWVLRRLTSKNTLDLVTNLGLSRLRNKTILGYLFVGCGDAEVSVWIWRVSFMSNFIATYICAGYTMSAVMADYSTLHMVNTIVQLIWWALFLMCLIKSPGYVQEEVAAINSRPRDINPNKPGTVGGFHPHSYDAALVLMGSDLATEEATAAKLPAVCHTCRVQKPLRSKHCKVMRKCVCKFDHFCPFIYNVVGRDNYKYFMSILIVHPLAYLLFLYSTICYWYRAPITWVFTMFLLYSFMMFLGIAGLTSYHLKLIMKNMTTNEEINMYRYTYFKNEFNMQDNPFCKGSKLGNFIDGMFPTSKLYYSREEVKKDLLSGAEYGGENEGYFEEAQSKLLQ